MESYVGKFQIKPSGILTNQINLVEFWQILKIFRFAGSLQHFQNSDWDPVLNVLFDIRTDVQLLFEMLIGLSQDLY